MDTSNNSTTNSARFILVNILKDLFFSILLLLLLSDKNQPDRYKSELLTNIICVG